MMPRFFLVGACLLFGANFARADLDAETGSPYKLQIVLHFAANKSMTDVFRTKVEQDVRDSLQAALGDLAVVDIVYDHPLLKDVLERGLQYSLDSWKSPHGLDGKKTHFVLIDFVQGQYVISARQYDGSTGLASPVVRRTQTGDRLLVAREAALLVYRDFGLVGTIQNAGDAKTPKVTVAIKGGALNAPLEHWIQKDDIFAVAEIVGQGNSQRSYRRPWTLLQVIELPKDGICVCRPLSRYDWPPPTTAGSLGLRCLKLGTTEGLLKMRLIGDDKQASPLILQVSVGAQGFDTPKEQLSTDSNGAVQSHEIYKNIAFVLIDDGSGARKTIPVEIVDDRTIVCVIKVNQVGERLGQFGIRRGSFLRRLDEDRSSVELLWTELQKEGSMTPQKWLARATEGSKVLQTELLALTKEFDQMHKEQLEMGKDPKIAKGDLIDLGGADQMLKGLEARREELDNSIKRMAALLKDGEFDKRAKWQAEILQAESMEAQANYAEALATYERITAEGSKDPGLKKRLDELKQLWLPRNQQHRQARAVIYEEWPLCTTARKVQEKLEEVKHAFLICKDADDHLTPRKLFFVNQDHAGQLRKELDEHRNADKEDDRDTLEILKTLAPDLEAFSKEVSDFLKPKPKTNTINK